MRKYFWFYKCLLGKNFTMINLMLNVIVIVIPLVSDISKVHI